MGRFETKKKKKKSGTKGIIPVLCVLALIAAMAVYVIPQVMQGLLGTKEDLPEEQTEVLSVTEPAEGTDVAVTQEPTVSGVNYPMELEGGCLVLENMLEYEGMNPDCGLETGSSIASVILQNVSDKYLSEATLTMELSDGNAVAFYISDLPAGKSAVAFATDNTQLKQGVVCTDVYCEAAWKPMAETESDVVSVSVDGITMTIKNNTAREIPALTIYYRDIFDEPYFGGKSYQCNVNNLPANGTAAVEALDSILGLIEVVRVEVRE